MFLGWATIPEAKSSKYHLWEAGAGKGKAMLACTNTPYLKPKILLEKIDLYDIPALEEWDICKKCNKIESEG